MKSQKILDDFNLLLKEGNIGFYSRCEVTEFFLYSKARKEALNLFTLLVFEDEPININDTKYLTEELISLRHKEYSCGIQRYYVSIENMKAKIEYLLKAESWNLSGKNLKLSDNFTLLPKQFIPVDSIHIQTPLNSLLKNNFHAHKGAYILERFDNKKSDLKFLLDDAASLRDLSDKIQEIIPVDFSKVSDRLGNIILQFPINILCIESYQKSGNSYIDISWNPKLRKEKTLNAFTSREFDKTITEFEIQKEIGDQHCLGTKKDQVKHIIFDPETQLILGYLNNIIYLNSISINSNIGMPKTRSFSTSDGNQKKSHYVDVFFTDKSIKIEQDKRIELQDWTHHRLYDQGKKEQREKLSFVQYGRKSSERKKALHDIRQLINTYGKGGTYLWDPFLSSLDIIQTLYFCKFYNSSLKAISSFTKKQKKVYGCDDFNEWICSNSSELKKALAGTKNTGLNLEFRVQHSNFGWAFHDRFLIFPDASSLSNSFKRAKAWSIGTSINSIGKSHHILQEVGNAQDILDAFNELWNELSHDSCLVWEFRSE